MCEKPVPATWDIKTIRRFWNYLGQNTQMESEYFSFQVGRALVRFLKRANTLSGPVTILDFGCGPGFLLAQLLNTGNRCYGFDFSDGTVEKVNKKFLGRKNWQGAISATNLPVAYTDASFDILTCIETLEHLLDEMIPSTLLELNRLLKVGGIAFFTVPYAEKLNESNMYCPFCNHEFHKVQHIRSFDFEAVNRLLPLYGFDVIYCKNLNLFELEDTRWGNRHKIKMSLKSMVNMLFDKLTPIKSSGGKYFLPRCSAGPNLCVLAKKRETRDETI